MYVDGFVPGEFPVVAPFTLRFTSNVLCTAVLIGPPTVVTAHHCIASTTSVSTALLTREFDGTESTIETSNQVGTRDLEIVHLKTSMAPPYAKLAKHAQVGETVYAAGYGCADHAFLQERAMVEVDDSDRSWDSFAQGVACHGDSGGGIWDAAGDLINIIDRIYPKDNVDYYTGGERVLTGPGNE